MPRYSTQSRRSWLKYSSLAGTAWNDSTGDTFPISLNTPPRSTGTYSTVTPVRDSMPGIWVCAI